MNQKILYQSIKNWLETQGFKILISGKDSPIALHRLDDVRTYLLSSLLAKIITTPYTLMAFQVYPPHYLLFLKSVPPDLFLKIKHKSDYAKNLE